MDDLVRSLRSTLGGVLIGVYLHGSAARGQTRSRSDVDVLVVASRSLDARERAELVALLLRKSGRHPRRDGKPRPVEVTVVSQPDLRPWRYPPRVDFLYGEWLRESVQRGRLPEPHIRPDLAVVLADVLTHGQVIFGPPTSRVLEPVPASDVAAASQAGVPQLLADLDSDTTNVLLTLARAWESVDTGQLESKDAAAAWALPRLSPGERAVLAHARSVYLDEVEEDWQPLRTRVRPTAERMAEEIV